VKINKQLTSIADKLLLALMDLDLNSSQTIGRRGEFSAGRRS
jgi:hypothetical protein